MNFIKVKLKSSMNRLVEYKNVLEDLEFVRNLD